MPRPVFRFWVVWDPVAPVRCPRAIVTGRGLDSSTRVLEEGLGMRTLKAMVGEGSPDSTMAIAREVGGGALESLRGLLLREMLWVCGCQEGPPTFHSHCWGACGGTTGSRFVLR